MKVGDRVWEREEPVDSLRGDLRELCAKGARASVSAFDLRTLLKLGGPLLVPALVFFRQSPDAMRNLSRLFGWLVR